MQDTRAQVSFGNYPESYAMLSLPIRTRRCDEIVSTAQVRATRLLLMRSNSPQRVVDSSTQRYLRDHCRSTDIDVVPCNCGRRSAWQSKVRDDGGKQDFIRSRFSRCYLMNVVSQRMLQPCGPPPAKDDD